MSDITDYHETEIKIIQPGAPVINSAWVVYKTDQVILIEVDLQSKYCSVNISSGNSVLINANEYSLHLDDSVDPDLDTWVEFPEAEGYSFFGHSSGRYTIQLTFFKRYHELQSTRT
jgi:hypothetical protein